ncbi:hypothetical protein CC80DRAFT_500760 [Byssothecium circinans]|uniref:Uncharacterized protein n=1 Tax=Byssothecium circinans TaxID=147558 RepID=A0A6A5UC20_9PLEO|nr:hypothetical protein CC80DRAFT_500760 [Byssothecium circinans]
MAKLTKKRRRKGKGKGKGEGKAKANNTDPPPPSPIPHTQTNNSEGPSSSPQPITTNHPSPTPTPRRPPPRPARSPPLSTNTILASSLPLRRIPHPHPPHQTGHLRPPRPPRPPTLSDTDVTAFLSSSTRLRNPRPLSPVFEACIFGDILAETGWLRDGRESPREEEGEGEWSGVTGSETEGSGWESGSSRYSSSSDDDDEEERESGRTRGSQSQRRRRESIFSKAESPAKDFGPEGFGNDDGQGDSEGKRITRLPRQSNIPDMLLHCGYTSRDRRRNDSPQPSPSHPFPLPSPPPPPPHRRGSSCKPHNHCAVWSAADYAAIVDEEYERVFEMLRPKAVDPAGYGMCARAGRFWPVLHLVCGGVLFGSLFIGWGMIFLLLF